MLVQSFVMLAHGRVIEVRTELYKIPYNLSSAPTCARLISDEIVGIPVLPGYPSHLLVVVRARASQVILNALFLHNLL
jgi:hypothetical protein